MHARPLSASSRSRRVAWAGRRPMSASCSRSMPRRRPGRTLFPVLADAATADQLRPLAGGAVAIEPVPFPGWQEDAPAAARLSRGMLRPPAAARRLAAEADVLHLPLTVPVPRRRGGVCSRSMTSCNSSCRSSSPSPSAPSGAWPTTRRRGAPPASSRTPSMPGATSPAARVVAARARHPPRARPRADAPGRGRRRRRSAGSPLPPGPWLYYPAALWPHKNHERLCAALARCPPELSLVLSGCRRRGRGPPAAGRRPRRGRATACTTSAGSPMPSSRRSTGARRPWCSRASARASACRRWRRWRAAPRSRPPTPRPWPRHAGTRPSRSRPATSPRCAAAMTRVATDAGLSGRARARRDSERARGFTRGASPPSATRRPTPRPPAPPVTAEVQHDLDALGRLLVQQPEGFARLLGRESVARRAAPSRTRPSAHRRMKVCAQPQLVPAVVEPRARRRRSASTRARSGCGGTPRRGTAPSAPPWMKPDATTREL